MRERLLPQLKLLLPWLAGATGLLAGGIFAIRRRRKRG
jgi:hypothetical protein